MLREKLGLLYIITTTYYHKTEGDIPRVFWIFKNVRLYRGESKKKKDNRKYLKNYKDRGYPSFLYESAQCSLF